MRKINLLLLFLSHGFHAQGNLFYRSSSHWELLGLVIESSSQLSHCHVWMTLLGMLHTIKKIIWVKLESNDPPRPSQSYKHQVGLMEQHVNLRTCQVGLIGGSRKHIYRARGLIWRTHSHSHKFDHKEEKKCEEEEVEGRGRRRSQSCGFCFGLLISTRLNELGNILFL